MQNPDEAIEQYQLAKKDRERERVIAAAQECYHPYSEWNIDIERFYAIAFEAGAASRDAKIGGMK